MSKKAVTHWNTPTQNDGKVQTLCGRLLNRRGLANPKSLDEVSCQHCNAIMKHGIEQILHPGRLRVGFGQRRHHFFGPVGTT
jgi:hypothetical protein